LSVRQSALKRRETTQKNDTSGILSNFLHIRVPACCRYLLVDLPTSQKAHPEAIANTNELIRFGEIIAVYCNIQFKRTAHGDTAGGTQHFADSYFAVSQIRGITQRTKNTSLRPFIVQGLKTVRQIGQVFEYVAQFPGPGGEGTKLPFPKAKKRAKKG
jgi:hypothetical protein